MAIICPYKVTFASLLRTGGVSMQFISTIMVSFIRSCYFVTYTTDAESEPTAIMKSYQKLANLAPSIAANLSLR